MRNTPVSGLITAACLMLALSCSSRNYDSGYVGGYYAAPEIYVRFPAENSIQPGNVSILCEAAALSGILRIEVDSGAFRAVVTNPEPLTSLTTNLILFTNFIFTNSGNTSIRIRAWNRFETVSETNVHFSIQGPTLAVSTVLPAITPLTNFQLLGSALSADGSILTPMVYVTAGAGFSNSFAVTAGVAWSAWIGLFTNRTNLVTVICTDSAGFESTWSNTVECDWAGPVASGSDYPSVTNLLNTNQAKITWQPLDNLATNILMTVILQTGGAGVTPMVFTNTNAVFSLPIPDVPLDRGGAVTDILVVMDKCSNTASFTNIVNLYPALWVSPFGNDANPGFADLPLLTLQSAADKAATLGGVKTVHAATGVYNSHDGSECLRVSGQLALDGAWDTNFSSRLDFTNFPTVIRGNGGILRAISVNPGADLTIDGVVIDNAGSVSGAEGGGIRVSNALLTLNSVLITNCSADRGAGIYAVSSTLRVSNIGLFLNTGRLSILDVSGGAWNADTFWSGWNYLSPAADSSAAVNVSNTIVDIRNSVLLSNSVRPGADLTAFSVEAGTLNFLSNQITGNGGTRSNFCVVINGTTACVFVSNVVDGITGSQFSAGVWEKGALTGQTLEANLFLAGALDVIYQDASNGALSNETDLNDPALTGAASASTNNRIM